MNVQHAPAHPPVSRERGEATNTRLDGHWLVLARVVWVVLAVFTLVYFFISLLAYAAHLREVCTSMDWITACRLGQLLTASLQVFHLSVDSYGVFNVALTLIWTLVWLSVAAVISWRRSDDWMALLVALLLVGGVTTATEIPIGLSEVGWAGQSLLPFFQFLGGASFILVFSFFPNGRFVPRWTGWLTIALIALSGVQAFFPDLPVNPNNWPPLLSTLLLLGTFGCLLFSQVYRYRRVSSPRQRQQTKWVVFAFSIIIVGVCAEVLGLEFLPQYLPALRPSDALYRVLDGLAWHFSLILIPVSFGIAILRYRLYDIDIIINRTLVYGTLTVILTAVYVGLVIGLQALLRGIISQDSSVAIVISTRAIAALFQPLRHRLQRVIDRRFYRSKYDAAKIVAAFSSTLRQEVDLDQLREHLVAVVEETMQPTFVSLWLRPTQHDGKRSAWGAHPLSSRHTEEPVHE